MTAAETKEKRGPLGFLRRRRDAANRKDFVGQLEKVWAQTHVRPFFAWFEGKTPGGDFQGPGGVRFAADSVWTLATLRTELHAWMDLGLGPPDEAALRSAVALVHRDFEIVHKFLAQRYPAQVPAWIIPEAGDMTTFWPRFQQAALDFEQGSRDEARMMRGLIDMMLLSLAWSGVHAGPR